MKPPPVVAVMSLRGLGHGGLRQRDSSIKRIRERFRG